MQSRIGLQWLPVSAVLGSARLLDRRLLGVVQFGGSRDAVAPGRLPHALLNKPVVPSPGVSAEPIAFELWSGALEATDLTVSTAGAGPVACRHNGAALFGAVTVPVASNGDDALGAAAYAAYRAMLDCLQAAGYPYLLRVWNSIPDINIDDQGLERYRRFNVQRFRAFSEAQLPTHTGAPAASALGVFGGPLVLHYLATREAPRAIENPRQVSAYNYPDQYGPRAPNFSRAALWRSADAAGDVLFISGTASIVGHETRHRGDVLAQTHETLANLKAVLAEAARVATADGAPRPALTLPDLTLKVYLRERSALAAVRATLAAEGIAVERVLFLHSDICRAELLVEIEAIGPAATVYARE